MKLILAWLTLGAGICFADGLTENRRTAGTNGVQLVWNVPSNHWPAALWVYKTVPQNFPPSVISNLMSLASFSKADQKRPFKRPAFQDDGLMIFRNEEGTRELVISPVLGWINYRDENARSGRKEHPENVPSEEQTYQMAIEYLKRFGIDRSQLATKGDTSELRNYKDFRRKSWFDKAQNKEVEEITSRGVFFIRRVDGVDFSGIGPRGGIYVSLGNHGKIVELEIVWRGIVPFELRNTLSSEQMLGAIRNGDTKWVSHLPNLKGIKTITITGVMPFYRGADGESDQKYIEPFTLLATSVDFGTTNVVANLECQFLGDPAPVQIRTK